MDRKYWSRKRIETVVKFAVAAIVLVWFIIWIIPENESAGELHYKTNSFRAAAVPEGSELPADSGEQVYAEDGNLAFSADLGQQIFTITDKRNGMKWSSLPDLSEEKIEPLAGKIVHSPFMLTYTKTQKDIFSTGIMQEETSWKAFKIANGLQIHYQIAKLNLTFVAEFVLEEGSLIVRLPEDSLLETGEEKLAAIQVLPFFGAAKQGDKGYMVVPDGSGALTYFDRKHNLFENRGYAKWIYGLDPTFDPLNGPVLSETIAVPVFGMVKPGGGYLQTIEQGAGDAMVFINPPGVLGLNYYRGGFELYYRKTYNAQFGINSKPVIRVERNRIRSDREIRFDFVAGEETSYADLAQTASDRLYKQTAAAATKHPLLVQLFSGVESRGDSYSRRLETLTSFDQAQDILASLREAGITELAAQIRGWYDGGYYGNSPQRFPVEKAFGGANGLTNLLHWANEQGITMSLDDNLIELYEDDPDHVKLRTDAVRKPDLKIFEKYPLNPTGYYRMFGSNKSTWRWLSPGIVQKKYFDKEIDKLKQLGAVSVDLASIGEALNSDYNSHYPMRREETSDLYASWVQSLQKQLGSAGVYYGNAYAAKYADRVLDVPMQTSQDYMLDEPIPLLQLIMHGKVAYYSKAINRSDDPQLQLLKSLEYGAIPSFELTYNRTTALKYTNYDFLFSSQYEDWLPTVQDVYRKWEETLKLVQDVRMTDHRAVAKDVFKTTYANGISIYVNYSDDAFTTDGISVDVDGYAVSKGGETQ